MNLSTRLYAAIGLMMLPLAMSGCSEDLATARLTPGRTAVSIAIDGLSLDDERHDQIQRLGAGVLCEVLNDQVDEGLPISAFEERRALFQGTPLAALPRSAYRRVHVRALTGDGPDEWGKGRAWYVLRCTLRPLAD